MTVEELKETKVGDLVYISKVFDGMAGYYLLENAQIPLQVGNIGVVVSRVLGKSAKCSYVNLKFETLNKDAPIMSVQIENVERLIKDEDCGIFCTVKHLYLTKDTSGSCSPAIYNNSHPASKCFLIGGTYTIKCFTKVGAEDKIVVGLLEPSGASWWYVGIEYVTLNINEHGCWCGVKLHNATATATGTVTSTSVKYCTPIEALQKACNGIKIGDEITYIPDDDTVEFIGITEAYVVTNEHIYVQLTDGNIVRVDKIKDKKGE